MMGNNAEWFPSGNLTDIDDERDTEVWGESLTASEPVPVVQYFHARRGNVRFTVKLQCLSDEAAWAIPVVRGLTQLLQLQPGWDGGHAKVISVEAIQHALLLLEGGMHPPFVTPTVIPLCTGGVQFEWNLHGMHIEVSVDSEGRADSIYVEDLVAKTEDEFDDNVIDNLHRALGELWQRKDNESTD